MKDSISFDPKALLPKVEGHYTIQLFDEAGNKIQEIKKHNVVNKLWYLRAFYNTFISGAVTGYIRAYAGSSDYIYSTNDYDYNLIYDTMYLTYDEQAPSGDDTSSMMWGKLLGRTRALKQENSNSSHTGNLNSNESKTSYVTDSMGKKISVTRHLVTDYATDRTNGIFNNIYLASSKCTVIDDVWSTKDYDSVLLGGDLNIYPRMCPEGIRYSHYTRSDTNTLNYRDQGVISVNKATKKFYFLPCYYLSSGSWVYGDAHVFERDMVTNAVKDIILKRPDDLASDQTHGKAYCGNYIFTFKYRSWGDLKLHKFNLNGDYVSSHSLNDITGFAHIHNYQYRYNLIGDENYLYFLFYESDTNPDVPTMRVITFDENLNVIRNHAIPRTVSKIPNNFNFITNNSYSTDNYGSYVSLIRQGEESWLGYQCFRSGYIGRALVIPLKPNEDGVYDYNHIPLFPSAIRNMTTHDSYSSPFLMGETIIDNKAYIPGYADNSNLGYSYGEYIMGPWFSHVKLDTPVTKTAVNTMKVIYDITIDYVYPGDPKYLN